MWLDYKQWACRWNFYVWLWCREWIGLFCLFSWASRWLLRLSHITWCLSRGIRAAPRMGGALRAIFTFWRFCRIIVGVAWRSFTVWDRRSSWWSRGWVCSLASCCMVRIRRSSSTVISQSHRKDLQQANFPPFSQQPTSDSLPKTGIPSCSPFPLPTTTNSPHFLSSNSISSSWSAWWSWTEYSKSFSSSYSPPSPSNWNGWSFSSHRFMSSPWVLSLSLSPSPFRTWWISGCPSTLQHPMGNLLRRDQFFWYFSSWDAWRTGSFCPWTCLHYM